VELAVAANGRNNGVICQYQGVLMHYNELQSRSAGVGDIYMKFEQKVADEVAKAGFRQKPGPKKGSIRNRQLDPKWGREEPAPDPPRTHPGPTPGPAGNKKTVLTADSLSL
jgi:hypothetical protein